MIGQDTLPRRALIGRRLLWTTGAAILVTTGVLWAAGGVGGAQWGVWTFAGLLMALTAAGGGWAAVVDARSHRLPDAIVYPLGAGLAVLTVGLALAAADPLLVLWAAIYAAGLFAVYYVIGLLGGMGLGDIKLAAVIGVFLAPYGLLTVVLGVALPYIAAIPQLLVHAARARGRIRGRSMAFGPYLLGGALAAVAIALLTGGTPG